MSLKQTLKSRFTVLFGIHKFIEFVKIRFVWPSQRTRFGHFGSTTELNTPAIIKNPANVFLYEDIRIREGLHVINHTGKFIVKKFAVIAADCTVVTGNHTPTVSVPQFVGGGRTYKRQRERMHR